MKKLLLTILTILPLFSISQVKNKTEVAITINTVEPFSPVHNLVNVDYGLNVPGETFDNSINVGLLGKYFINEDNAFRIKLNYTKININENYNLTESNTSTSDGYDNVSARQNIIKIAPGYQWGIHSKKISFFGGLEIPFSLISDFKFINDNYIDDGSTIQSGKSEVVVPGGFSAGLGFFIGSNYYFTKHLGIGFEVNTAYRYSKIGGLIKTTNEDYQSNTVTYTEGESFIIKQTKFSNFQGSLNFTIRF